MTNGKERKRKVWSCMRTIEFENWWPSKPCKYIFWIDVAVRRTGLCSDGETAKTRNSVAVFQNLHFCFIFSKWDQTNTIAWNFHSIFFTQRRKITEVFDSWDRAIFQLKNYSISCFEWRKINNRVSSSRRNIIIKAFVANTFIIDPFS